MGLTTIPEFYRAEAARCRDRAEKAKTPERATRWRRVSEDCLRLAAELEAEPSMCDYSLHNVAARPAKVGDTLVSTRFPNSITRGFAAIGEPTVSVCLPPGTELAFEAEVKYEAAIALLPKKKLGERLARFRYVGNGAYSHRDALEFPSG